MAWVVPDFETRSMCDLKKAGAYRYAEDPTTEVLCLSIAEGDGAITTWFPGDSVEHLRELAGDPNVLWVAHNAQFEKQIWRQIMVPMFGLPDIPNGRWHCTQARAANLALPQQLEKLVKVPLLEIDGEKDMAGSRLTVGLSRAPKKGKTAGYLPEITPFTLLRVGQYCEADVREQRAVHKRLGWLRPDERQVYLYDQRINERGVRLDMPLVRSMQQVVDKASGPLMEEFRTITGGLNMTQVAKVGDWMAMQGVILPDMKKETLAAVLGETDEGEEVDDDDRLDLALPPHVHRALHIRQLIGSASIKKLGAMQACVCSDGRARGLLAYHGAGTGRWAGRLLQPQNFPRGSVKGNIDALVAALMTGDPEWIEMTIGKPPVETVLSCLRHTIIASPGRILAAGDYAGIEARITLALAGQLDKVALMAAGADVYCDMASDIYGRPITKADVEERQIGKNSVLGLGFGMGWRKFRLKYCPEQPEEFAQKVVKTYRETWAPKVCDLWYALEAAACKAVWEGGAHEAYGITYCLRDCFLVATYHDGSECYYYNPQRTRRPVPWDENDIRPGWSYQAMKLGRLKTIDAFGGLLAENAAQHLARQLMANAIKTCEKEDFPVILSVHDEGVTEPRKDRDSRPKTLLEQLMEDVPAWAREIKVPVKAEAWDGERYRK